MFAKSSVLFLTAVVTGACAAHIPTIYNYGTVSAAEHLHHVESHQFLVTDITKPSTKAAFVANFFSNSCNNGFLGQVTGSGGANCVQSISGTKGIALISQPDGCAVTIYTDASCTDNPTLLVPGQCLQETEVGIPSYSIDGKC